MNYNFKNTYRKSMLIFYIILGISVVAGLFGYFVLHPVFSKIEPTNEGYYHLNSVMILATLASIPFTLKYYKIVLNKIIEDNEENEVKFKRYFKNATIRTCIIGSIFILNVMLFFATNDKFYLFCLGISFCALMFCITGKQKIKNELELDGDFKTLMNS